MSDATTVINDCIERWGGEDERTKTFSELYREWLDNIEEENKQFIIDLLHMFCYYPHSKTNFWLKELHNRLITEHKITDDNTIYSSIESKSGICNSSDEYANDYKLYNNISKYIFYDDIHKINSRQWAVIENVVFIDDCSGSGKTFTDYLKLNLNLLQSKNIYLIAIHVMSDAINHINDFAKESNITIEVINAVTQDKAFNHNFESYDNQKVKELFINASKKLGIPGNHILGFDKCESLLAFYNNTPNNTLGLFWYDTKYNKSIFPRKNDKRPSWYSLKEDTKERSTLNYNVYARSR